MSGKKSRSVIAGTGFSDAGFVCSTATGPGEIHVGPVWIDTLARRLKMHVERSETLKPQSAALLEAALMRGEIERGAGHHGLA
jgi:hypothetical protein